MAAATPWGAIFQTGYSDGGTIVRETMAPQIDYYERELSPFFKNKIATSAGVMPTKLGGWGRNWEIIKTFRTGVSGTFGWADVDPVGNVALHPGIDSPSDPNPNFQVFGTSAYQTWPSAAKTTAPAYFNWKFGLCRGKGNVHFPAELLRIDAMDAAIGEQYGALIDGCAELVAMTQCNAFHAESVTPAGATYPLDGIIGAVSAADFDLTDNLWPINTASDCTLTMGSIRRFAEGMPVDLYYVSSTTAYKMNDNSDDLPVWVNIADAYGDKVTLFHTGAGSGTSDGIDSGNSGNFPTSGTIYLVQRGTYAENVDLSAATSPRLPYGWERVLKSSGTLYGTTSGSIDLARHPWFRSYVIDNVGATLDETLFLEYLARIFYARSFSMAPDEFWMTPGVFNSYITNGLEGVYFYERNGERVTLDQGVAGTPDSMMKFSAFGKTFSIGVDPFIGKGKCFGVVSKNNNWKKYVPPKLKGAGSKEGFDQSVEWLVPVVNPGANGIFQGTKTSGGETTDLMEAPFSYFSQWVPDVLPGIVFKGCVEAYGPTV
jgi:hypothetical protein